MALLLVCVLIVVLFLSWSFVKLYSHVSYTFEHMKVNPRSRLVKECMAESTTDPSAIRDKRPCISHVLPCSGESRILVFPGLFFDPTLAHPIYPSPCILASETFEARWDLSVPRKYLTWYQDCWESWFCPDQSGQPNWASVTTAQPLQGAEVSTLAKVVKSNHDEQRSPVCRKIQPYPIKCWNLKWNLISWIARLRHSL